MMKEITAEEFEQEVEEGIVMLQFFATWCQPCKALKLQMDRVKEEVGDKIKIVQVDVDKETEFAVNNEVFSVPTVLLFKDGELKDKFIGLKQKEAIIPWVKEKAGDFE